MLSIFVCEDDPAHLKHITECVKKYIMMEGLAMEVVCSTASPADILDYLKNNQVAGLYFLDLDLGCDMNGIQLAEAIRTYDPRGFIIFITADADSHILTFEYKIEAMDYIVKGALNLDARICECIRNADEKYTSKSTPLQENFVFKLSKDTQHGVQLPKDSVVSIECSKILYMETSPDTPHNIVVYTENSRHEFRGKLSQAQKELNESFFRCHRSFIVNIRKITAIDAALLKIHLVNGGTVDIAAKYVKKVRSLMEEG